MKKNCFFTLIWLLSPVLLMGEVLTNSQVVKLNNLLGEEITIAKINEVEKVDFNLTIDGLSALKKLNVTDSIIKAMLQRKESEREITREQSNFNSEKQNFSKFQKEFMGIENPEPKIETNEGARKILKTGGYVTSKGIGAFSFFQIRFEGTAARVRTKDLRPSIIIKTDYSPKKRYFLVRLKPKQEDNHRVLRMGKIQNLKLKKLLEGIIEHHPLKKITIPYTTEQTGENEWKITPKRNLFPGEYGLYFHVAGRELGSIHNPQIYDFGINHQVLYANKKD